jgi:hypothetical protein
MLEKFKAGVAANVDDEDFDSYYDLGVAYRRWDSSRSDRGFQKALRGATQRIRAYEALGRCFIDPAISILRSLFSVALREPGMEDEDLIGVLYLSKTRRRKPKAPRCRRVLSAGVRDRH